MSMSVFVCMQTYRPNHTRARHQIFYACCLWPWLGPSPAGWRNPKGRAIFGFFPHSHCIVQHSIWDPYKDGWSDRDAVWYDEWAWPEEQCVTWGDHPQRGRGNFGGKRAQQAYHPYNSMNFTTKDQFRLNVLIYR